MFPPEYNFDCKAKRLVKDTKLFVRSLFQAIGLWLVKIKIATLEYPPLSKNIAGDLTAPIPPKKNARQWTWKRNPYKLNAPLPSLLSPLIEDGIQTFQSITIVVITSFVFPQFPSFILNGS